VKRLGVGMTLSVIANDQPRLFLLTENPTKLIFAAPNMVRSS